MQRDAPHLELAHAKVNLTLAVLAREESGFHQIETLFCALELADEVELRIAGDDVELSVVAPDDDLAAPPDLGPVEKNLATRAARAFIEAAGEPAGVRIRIAKRIPAGAGLGGGSTDAAAVLNGLNHLCGEPLSRSALLGIAARLGSDIPFFLTGSALALAWGRGTRLAPLPALPSRPVLLAVPAERVPTGDAYAALATLRGSDWTAPPRLVQARLNEWSQVSGVAHNDFEDVVFGRIRMLAPLRDAMAARGAIIARLTGTGSVVFGVFDDVAAAEAALAVLRSEFAACDFLLTRTLESV